MMQILKHSHSSTPNRNLTNNVNGGVATKGAPANQKVFRFDVPVHNVFAVDVFKAGDNLDGNHAHGLQAEPPATHLKQIFQARAQQLQDEAVVFATAAKVVALWDAD